MIYTRIIPSQADRIFYEEKLKDFLPEKIFDTHIHTWKLDQIKEPRFRQRGEDWAELIEEENPFERLQEDYSRMVPDTEVTGLLFGWISAKSDVEAHNRYVGQIVKAHPGWHGLAVTYPHWTAAQTKAQIEENGLCGMKPYITFVDSNIETANITIYDMLTKEQLELADQSRYICTIHLPRPGRMADPENIAQLLEIDEKYPNARIIVAHMGRCYSNEDMGDAFEKLRETKNLCFDFSGNTNSNVIKKGLETFGVKRILFGSDLPLSHIHLKRIYENGHYVNLINGNERPQINTAAYMRPMLDAEQYTFFLYESIGAFRQAAIEQGLSRAQVQDVMYGNAKRLMQR